MSKAVGQRTIYQEIERREAAERAAAAAEDQAAAEEAVLVTPAVAGPTCPVCGEPLTPKDSICIVCTRKEVRRNGKDTKQVCRSGQGNSKSQ